MRKCSFFICLSTRPKVFKHFTPQMDTTWEVEPIKTYERVLIAFLKEAPEGMNPCQSLSRFPSKERKFNNVPPPVATSPPQPLSYKERGVEEEFPFRQCDPSVYGVGVGVGSGSSIVTEPSPVPVTRKLLIVFLATTRIVASPACVPAVKLNVTMPSVFVSPVPVEGVTSPPVV